MSEIWYRKLGFYANPFSIKPGAYDTDLVAYDLSQIFKKIKKGEMIFIEGDFGTGKTTILKNIIYEFKGKNKIIYYSFNSGENSFKINEFLDGATSLFKKIIGLNEKNLIFLLDEVHLMKETDSKKLLKPYQDGIIKSIVFVSHAYDEVNFSPDFLKFLKGNIIKTIDLTNKESIVLVRKRIGNLSIIDDKSISKIFLLADKNPRRLLQYCEDVIKYTVEIGDNKVTDYHIEEILKEVIKEKKRKIVKVKTPEIKKSSQEIKSKIVLDTISENNLENTKTIELEKEHKEKKFKVNKLIAEPNKNSLGTITEKENNEKKEDTETSEYKIYYVDK